MSLFDRTFGRRDDTTDDEYPTVDGHDEDNLPLLSPPEGLTSHQESTSPAGDSEGEGRRPDLTSNMVRSVKFPIAEGQGYFYPPVEAFCDQVIQSLAWHEANTRDLRSRVDNLDMQNRELIVANRRLGAQLSVFSATGDAVVGADGQFVTADPQVEELQNELAGAHSRIEELVQQAAESDAKVEALERELDAALRAQRLAEEAQHAAEVRESQWRSALEAAREAGITPERGQAPVVEGDAGPEGEQATVGETSLVGSPGDEVRVEDDVVVDDDDYYAGDDVVDIEDFENAPAATTGPVDTVPGGAGAPQHQGSIIDEAPTAPEVEGPTEPSSGELTPAQDAAGSGRGEAVPDGTGEPQDRLAAMFAAADAEPSLDEGAAQPVPDQPRAQEAPQPATPETGDAPADDSANEQDSPAREDAPQDRLAAMFAAADAEPVLPEGDKDRGAGAPTYAPTKPGDPLSLNGRSLEDYAPELIDQQGDR